jgi:formylglycine-generating enzyme
VSARSALVALHVLAVAGLSCAGEAPVRAQWVVTLRTDAPLPLVADRLLVETVRDDGSLACDTCRRLLDARPEHWPISFGIGEISPMPSLRVRARLHRSTAVGLDGAPAPESTLDAVVALPREPGPVHIELRMDCFGVASTSTESCNPATRELTSVRNAQAGAGDRARVPGSWPQSSSPPCASEAPAGMACVPGGLFFFRGFDGDDARRDQLVRLSSFFADRDEMTVGHARALIAAKKVTSAPDRRGTGTSPSAVCSYLGEGDASNDDRPLNCVELSLAEELCDADGKRLLTEAEFAYAAGNGARGTVFPWGDEGDACGHAIVARGAAIGEANPPDLSFECRSQGTRTAPFGPVVGGSPQDVTASGLLNLGGNLSEWVKGSFALLREPCWTGRPLLVDPRCEGGEAAVLRGGSWRWEAWSATSRFRVSSSAEADTSVGFRCARDAR